MSGSDVARIGEPGGRGSEGSALAIRAEQSAFNRQQVAALKRMNGWDETPEAELSVFFHQCQRTGLDPFARQIYLIGRNNRRAGRTDYTIQVGIDGFRLIADRTGRYAGSDRPRYGEEEGEKYAEVTVYKIVAHVRVPFTALAFLSEYRQNSPMWQRMWRNQLAKCAEALALRKAFPADLSGLYTHEEMEQAGEPVRAVSEIAGAQDASPADAPRGAQTAAEGAEPSADEVEGEVVEEGVIGDVKAGQITDIENLSWWIFSEKRAVEEKALGGRRLEELSEEAAGKLLRVLRRKKEEMQAEEATAGGRGEAVAPPHPDRVEGVEKGGAANRGEDKGELPATRKQLNYLEALIDEALEGGIPEFEQGSGVKWGELSREGASNWIKQISGRQS